MEMEFVIFNPEIMAKKQLEEIYFTYDKDSTSRFIENDIITIPDDFL